MKKLLFIPCALLIMFLMTSCVSNQVIDQKLYDQHLTRTFNYSKDKTFDATIAALNELKMGVKSKNRKKGLITSNKSSFYTYVQVRGGSYSATGQSFTATHKYYLKITGNKKQATINAVRYRLWKNAVEQTEMNSAWTKTNVWDPFFATIKEHLEEP